MRTPAVPFLIGLLLLPLHGVGQAPFCGSDALRALQDPALVEAEAELNAALAERAFSFQPGQRGGGPLIVPVVFHVVHDGGPENVSDATITAAVDELNLRFQNAAPWQDATGHVVNVQFCLATVDPFGATTTGITHTQSPLTWHDGDEEPLLKALAYWNPYLYLNVWTVAEIQGNAAGYATYPNSLGTLRDGIVMEAGYLLNSHVLAHEAGHYLNLYHTFAGCWNLNCALHGDQVCDTPPDSSQFGTPCLWNSCNSEMQDTSGLNPFTSDVPELPNYMDYTSCPLSFTQGQADRMYDAVVLARSALLQSNGCGSNPGAALPVAAFTIDSSLCTGHLRFISTSTNSLFTAWDWENDGTWDQTGADVTHAYPATGDYTVRMLASGFGGADTVVHVVHARVPPDPEYPIAPDYTGLSLDPFMDDYRACSGSTFALNSVPGMSSWQWSTGATTAGISFTVDSSFAIQVTATDSNGLAWKNCQLVQAVVNQPLSIVANIPNGSTIICGDYVLMTFEPTPYYNVPNNTWYHNGVAEVTNQYNVPLIALLPGSHAYWVTNTDVNGCTLPTDTFTFEIVQLPPPVISQVGNMLLLDHDCLNVNWFLDSVVFFFELDSFLLDPAPGCYHVWCGDCVQSYSDTFCVTVAGLGEVGVSTTISLRPVPVVDRLYLSRMPATGADLVILDAAGREMRHFDARRNDTDQGLDVSFLTKGIYFLRVEEGGRPIVLRFVK